MMREVLRSLRKMKGEKSSALNGFTSELLKNGSDCALKWLIRLHGGVCSVYQENTLKEYYLKVIQNIEYQIVNEQSSLRESRLMEMCEKYLWKEDIYMWHLLTWRKNLMWQVLQVYGKAVQKTTESNKL